jgi:hypothetical protein
MELQIKAAKIIVHENSVRRWMGKSIKRKRLIQSFIDRFTVNDWGEIDAIDRLQNEFIIMRNDSQYLTLTGYYPLPDDSGQISIKRIYHDAMMIPYIRVEFNVCSKHTEPKLIRSGNVIRFNFAQSK